ncbi:LysR family transcriptional regulator [Pseudomonas gingeri]|uniref:LysR family transcriptional regulator n=1 Tax=Pseudomonas gingeri TaxID=117681 RepID=UPI0015A0A704|nr:LysR family transcriptional regulator [Pseudomonas gingeri]NWD72009.1 LysR family transcriptional regulator [Pseudomonas gingeri]NWD75263.1 LysR family transcriptional regulator [Pseudomonas gingeri]
MDRVSAIRLFVRLVECGSFSAVGRAEGIGQPAVSKQIGALERHLGAQLVMRTSRQVVITEAGQTFYESARKLVDDFDALESSVGDRQKSPEGLIRVNTAPAHGRLCITPLLPEFFRQFPNIAIEVSVSERHVDLVGDGIDLAIRHGRLVDSSLTARKLSETDFVLVASPAYLALMGVPTRLADLDQHRCIVFTKNRDRYPWSLKVGQEIVSYVPHGALLTGDAEHIRTAVLSGLGIAQAPFWLLAQEIRSGQVQVLLPALQPERLPIHLVYPAGRRVPMRVRMFIEYLVSAFENPEP